MHTERHRLEQLAAAFRSTLAGVLQHGNRASELSIRDSCPESPLYNPNTVFCNEKPRISETPGVVELLEEPESVQG